MAFPVGDIFTPPVAAAREARLAQQSEQVVPPGFKLGDRAGQALNDAIGMTETDGERSSSLRYTRGVAQNMPKGRRFAGDEPTVREIMIARIDNRGFGEVADSAKRDSLARNYLTAKAEQLFESPMSDGGMA